ncbi:MAG: T9SS type A sorting domain-containing protein [bacterium]|nr:T9SS type A sorting domain-containing protein [bacterium]
MTTGEGPRRLKTAWVAWDEFVDTPDQSAPAPQEFTLSAYPNPFNSSVTISFELPRSGGAELNIFDLNGRLVETLRDDFSTAGTHTLNWSPKSAASGVYFATLEASFAHTTQKILYLK